MVKHFAEEKAVTGRHQHKLKLGYKTDMIYYVIVSSRSFLIFLILLWHVALGLRRLCCVFTLFLLYAFSLFIFHFVKEAYPKTD